MSIRIETPNLILRPYLPSDSKDVAFYSQQPKVAYWMSDMVLHNESEALNWINWINGKMNYKEPFIILAIEHKKEGICIGIVGVHPKDEINNEVEVLYGVSDNYQNKGFATEASKVLIQWVFENIQLDYLSAIVKPENIPSKNVIEKLGFVFVDTRDVPYDGQICKFYYYKLYNNELKTII